MKDEYRDLVLFCQQRQNNHTTKGEYSNSVPVRLRGRCTCDRQFDPLSFVYVYPFSYHPIHVFYLLLCSTRYRLTKLHYSIRLQYIYNSGQYIIYTNLYVLGYIILFISTVILVLCLYI